MLDSDKECCTILAKLLVAKGVKRVVLSTGSRNAPLIVSFAVSYTHILDHETLRNL